MKFATGTLNVLFDALRDAEDYKNELADAFHNKGSEARAASLQVKMYYELRRKIAKELGRPMKSKMEMEIDNAEALTITEIKVRLGAEHQHDFRGDGPVLVCECGEESDIVR